MIVPGTVQEHKRRLESELRVFVDRWSRDPSVKKIILFGSVARGNIHRGSDLDLIIVQETDKKFLSRLEPFYRDARIAMDILVYTPDEFAAMTEGVFLKNALRDGVVIYEAGTGKRREQMAEASGT
ncbi:MAG: nucleotidyltransferase domain-containing protein [Methanomicrobiaceae archaeon]|nr:nucleotidyltransferase domain-containing protein [Methanomicrobiaceae archaeon]